MGFDESITYIPTVLESPHVAVGAAIATKIPNPLIAIPLAIGSHFILDRIPHWNPHSYTETQKNGRVSKNTIVFALTDVAVSLAIGFYIASRALPDYRHAAVILAASFFAVLPDLAKSPYFLLNQRKGLIKKYVDFERSLQVETKFAVGMTVQLLVIAASFWWIS
ncbi:hypothetical protein A2630_03030 [Candidatus Woesebacteria bacterium RIFCSPHIGHO2_01_FULL_44_10]|uniref:Uncharacterized protein n=1 Tax=Candidatus Woesebacteria bacterium RIFCSPLOWO2_01_FULL_44_14 TaxID=1802525 RepID=A0A1F8C2K0_9BACT|nr:MAG: hypothetical protein A2630_03030 [Candidatus Woesebacteria bacterium RIFCSPHIGHO2_01_FULL_44_10]OGM55756.1 MAG: hypothetical protein A3F62_04720 [Candidatus Woesebacteria bacterium RIFCSPHIGHO2_12_FULL_44_11]OGM70543.1 MAG: hypothetical protein A2975_02060 [Candidatus Woesebacteria bacterium RIFCSPLOWO2_01_FULL_44_14]